MVRRNDLWPLVQAAVLCRRWQSHPAPVLLWMRFFWSVCSLRGQVSWWLFLGPKRLSFQSPLFWLGSKHSAGGFCLLTSDGPGDIGCSEGSREELWAPCTAARSLLIYHLSAWSRCCNSLSSIPTPVWHSLYSAMDCVSHQGHPAHSKLPLVLLLLPSGSSPSLTTLGLSGAVQGLPLACSLLPSGDSSLLHSSTTSSSSSGSLILSTSISPVVSVMLLLLRLSVKTLTSIEPIGEHSRTLLS